MINRIAFKQPDNHPAQKHRPETIEMYCRPARALIRDLSNSLAELFSKSSSISSCSSMMLLTLVPFSHRGVPPRWAVSTWYISQPTLHLTIPAAKRSTMKTTRKPSYRWQTRATRKHAKNCSNSTCLQRCRWQYWPIFMRLAVVASKICEIQRNSLKIQTYEVQGHPRSSILVPIESPYVTCY